MRELVQSALPRRRKIAGKWLTIRPPTIEEALTLFVTQQGFVTGVSEDTGVFKDVLRQWLPTFAADEFTKEPTDHSAIVKIVAEITLEGIVEKKNPNKGGRELENIFRFLIGRYAVVFSVDPQRVYKKVGWPWFLHWMGEVVRQEMFSFTQRIRVKAMEGKTAHELIDFQHTLEREMQFKAEDPFEASERAIKNLENLKADMMRGK